MHHVAQCQSRFLPHTSNYTGRPSVHRFRHAGILTTHPSLPAASVSALPPPLDVARGSRELILATDRTNISRLASFLCDCGASWRKDISPNEKFQPLPPRRNPVSNATLLQKSYVKLINYAVSQIRVFHLESTGGVAEAYVKSINCTYCLSLKQGET